MGALTDVDLSLFAAGHERRAYSTLGAHLTEEGGQPGVRFAVWAPHAQEVHLVGDFNRWRRGGTPLTQTDDSGIWEGFVPGVEAGARYRYALRPSQSRRWIEKADPFAFAAELRPGTASIVADLSNYTWHDGGWMEARTDADWPSRAMSVYEVHPGSWRRDPSDPEQFLTYRDLAEQLPEYAARLGFTHIELMGIAEYPYDPSWGYQVTGYFAPTARYGTPQEFMMLVDRCHQRGLGVILDWVSAHFPRDAHGLGRFDGTPLYEHADARRGEHPDWGTYIFNYGRGEVRSFLVSNAVFWLDCYHIDGLRADAVSSMLYLDYSRKPGEWIPNRFGSRENLEGIEFLQEMNRATHAECHGILTIAEEATSWPGVTRPVETGGLGFDLKWNMGWMHDVLQYIERDPIYRSYHQKDLTFSLTYAFDERYILPLSHDEVVHEKRSLLEKMPGNDWQQFANLRLLYGSMWTHPGKKLLFMGGEFGQQREWNYAAALDWSLLEGQDTRSKSHAGLVRLVHDLNALYATHAALFDLDFDPGGFQWLDKMDEDASIIVFRRLARDESREVIAAGNFTPVIRAGYRLALPHPGEYRVILNTDDVAYGGRCIQVAQSVVAEPVQWRGQPCSAAMTLPPLAIVILEPVYSGSR